MSKRECQKVKQWFKEQKENVKTLKQELSKQSKMIKQMLQEKKSREEQWNSLVKQVAESQQHLEEANRQLLEQLSNQTMEKESSAKQAKQEQDRHKKQKEKVKECSKALARFEEKLVNASRKVDTDKLKHRQLRKKIAKLSIEKDTLLKKNQIQSVSIAQLEGALKTIKVESIDRKNEAKRLRSKMRKVELENSALKIDQQQAQRLGDRREEDHIPIRSRETLFTSPVVKSAWIDEAMGWKVENKALSQRVESLKCKIQQRNSENDALRKTLLQLHDRLSCINTSRVSRKGRREKSKKDRKAERSSNFKMLTYSRNSSTGH